MQLTRERNLRSAKFLRCSFVFHQEKLTKHELRLPAKVIHQFTVTTVTRTANPARIVPWEIGIALTRMGGVGKCSIGFEKCLFNLNFTYMDAINT